MVESNLKASLWMARSRCSLHPTQWAPCSVQNFWMHGMDSSDSVGRSKVNATQRTVRASAHTHASAHPSILTVLWFFEVLQVTAHHAKSLHSESEGRSAQLTLLRLFRLAHTRLWPHSQCASPAAQTLCTANDDWMLRQWGYESVHFIARYSFLHCRAGLDEARMKQQCKSIWYPLASNVASRVGHI